MVPLIECVGSTELPHAVQSLTNSLEVYAAPEPPSSTLTAEFHERPTCLQCLLQLR